MGTQQILCLTMASSNRGTSPIPIPVDTVEVTLHDVDEKLARAFDDDTCGRDLLSAMVTTRLWELQCRIDDLEKENEVLDVENKNLLSMLHETGLQPPAAQGDIVQQPAVPGDSDGIAVFDVSV